MYRLIIEENEGWDSREDCASLTEAEIMFEREFSEV